MQLVPRGVWVVLLVAALGACAVATGADTRSGVRQPGAGSVRGAGPAPGQATVREAAGPHRGSEEAKRPDIVLVLMDDFSMDLLQTMRSAEVMRRHGASYAHAYVVDSLCCVSRASLLTGQYPHQTGVLTNVSGETPGSPLGGFAAFEEFGNPRRSVNVALQAAGYETGFIGKFLNEYEYVPGLEPPPVLPGWSVFRSAFGSAYDQWDFWSASVGEGDRVAVTHHPAPPATAPDRAKDRAYAGRWIGRRALRFIRQHRDDDAPYFLEVAPYGPHSRTNPQGHYPDAPRFPAMHRDRPTAAHPEGNCGLVPCGRLTTDDLPGYADPRGDNTLVTGDGSPAPTWNTGTRDPRPPVHVKLLRDRARMVASIDRMVSRILDAVDEDTYVVLTSDNGFHLGQSGLDVGKGTAYDSDGHVPLLVVGPGVVPGERTQMTSNIDLAPTLEELAGLEPAAYRSGRSIVDNLRDPAAPIRDHVFIEHTGQARTRLDPDAAFTGGELDRIPSYVAVRTRDALLVRYDLATDPALVRHAFELYSYDEVSWERTNTFTDPAAGPQVRRLRTLLERFDRCAGITGAEPVPPRCRDITG